MPLEELEEALPNVLTTHVVLLKAAQGSRARRSGIGEF